MTTTKEKLPIPVKRALRKIGNDIRDARLRRKIPTGLMSERTSMTRSTLRKIERGDPGVSLGKYATVLFALGMVERLTELADVRNDETGLQLDEERLPKRIRLSQKPRSAPSKKKCPTSQPEPD